MSWFRHRPKAKEPSRMTPYRTSPIAERQLKETKEKVRSIDQDKDPKNK